MPEQANENAIQKVDNRMPNLERQVQVLLIAGCRCPWTSGLLLGQIPLLLKRQSPHAAHLLEIRQWQLGLAAKECCKGNEECWSY